MIHHLNFVDGAVPAPAVEGAGVASAFANDVRAVLDAARPFESTLVMLGEFAIVELNVAVREAAGRPNDARWRTAYSALDRFVAYHARHAKGSGESQSFGRLSNFLTENADLARTPVGSRDFGDPD